MRKHLISLAVASAMATLAPVASAATSTVIGSGGNTGSYTFLDGATSIGSLDITSTTSSLLSFTFSELSNFLTYPGSSLNVSYKKGNATTTSTYGSSFFSGGKDSFTQGIAINNGYKFSGATLTYSVVAVPEPGTYGMFMAGLGLLGYVATRKKKSS